MDGERLLVDGHRQVVVGRVRGDQLDLAPDELAEIDRVGRQLDPGPLRSSAVEEALDQRREALPLVVDDLQVLAPRA